MLIVSHQKLVPTATISSAAKLWVKEQLYKWAIPEINGTPPLKVLSIFGLCHDTSILLKYQSLCVCMCVCPAMRFAMLRGTELKVGMRVGDGSTRFVGIFSKGPHLRSKVIQGSICLRNTLWLPNLVRRTPDQSIVHCWGQRSCRGHLGSTGGQIA